MAGQNGAGKDGASKDAEDPSQIATPAVLYVTSDGSRSASYSRSACASASAMASTRSAKACEGQTIVVDTGTRGTGRNRHGMPDGPPRPGGGGGGGGGFRRGGM